MESPVSITLRAEARRARTEERLEAAERLELAATWIEAVAADDRRKLEAESCQGRVVSGAVFGRWTVVRAAGFKLQSGRRRSRCLVRCVCGAERVAFEYMLKGEKTTGCTSRKCLSRWEAGEAIRADLHADLDRRIDDFIRGKGGPDNV